MVTIIRLSVSRTSYYDLSVKILNDFRTLKKLYVVKYRATAIIAKIFSYYFKCCFQSETSQEAAMRTLMENLADMGGLKVSKLAYDYYLEQNQ